MFLTVEGDHDDDDGDDDDDDDDVDDDALAKAINFRGILPPSRTIRRMGSRSTV